MYFRLIIILFFIQFQLFGQEILLPIDLPYRNSLDELRLTEIGAFGLMRKARPKVAAHYHTGIDIMRPGINYKNNLIFPITDGVVISKRDDGPFAQLIVEHNSNGDTFWTVYEHIAGIKVNVDDMVDAGMPIARFMNKEELNNYGWQFDHFHLEILKVAPMKLKATPKTPERYYHSFSLICYTQEDLETYFYHPMGFFDTHFRK